MAGRGLRVSPDKENCLVLDFAGNINRHGPITAINPGKKKATGAPAPVKTCPSCDEIVQIGTMECPSCGHVWQPIPQEEPDLRLSKDAEIMVFGEVVNADDESKSEHWVLKVVFTIHKSKTSGKTMIKATYHSRSLIRFARRSDVTEYLNIHDDGLSGKISRKMLEQFYKGGGHSMNEEQVINSPIESLVSWLNANITSPSKIIAQKENGYWRVKKRIWT